MRSYDKKYNIKKINLLLEERYVLSKSSINESHNFGAIHNIPYKKFNLMIDEFNKSGIMKPTGRDKMINNKEYQEYSIGSFNGEELAYWGGSMNNSMYYDLDGILSKFIKNEYIDLSHH